MRDAGGVAHEQHGRRHPRREHPGVVSGPGGQHGCLHPGCGEYVRDPVPQPLVEMDRRGVRLLPRTQGDPALLGISHGCRLDRGYGCLQPGLVRGPGVQPGYYRGGDSIGAARFRDHLADRSQRPVIRSRAASREHRSGVRQHRVLAVGEPGGSRVVGAALKVEPPAAVRPNPLGDADGGVQRGEGTALLDVQFDERADAAEQVLAGADRAGVVARGAHRLGQRDAVVVAEGPGGVRLDGPGNQTAPQARNAKPSAFFLGKDGNYHRPFGIKVPVFQYFYGGQRGRDAERSVVAPAVGNRIKVATGDDGVSPGIASRVSGGCWVPPGPQVAVVIGFHGQAEFGGLRGEPGAALRVGRGPGIAAIAAGPGVAAERFELAPEIGETHSRAIGTRTPRSVATVAALS